MKIGIIVYSQSGNTFSVAEKIVDALKNAGHMPEMLRLQPVGGEEQQAQNIRFDTLPNPGGYDGLVFAASVRGFSLVPVMTVYLDKIKGQGGKPAACLITQSFPYKWMGGNQSMGKLKALCAAKGCTVKAEEIVGWSRKNRDELIAGAVKTIINAFENK